MVTDFLISLLQDFRNASVLTKTTAISALAFFVLAPAGVIGAWYRRGVTRLQEENAELKRECRERRRAEEELRRDVAGLRPQTIAGLAERVAFERRDGNEERAIALIRSFVDYDAAALGPLCREIAGWHLSMVEGDPPGERWTAAKRFATLAVHLDPGNGEAVALLAEIKARTGDVALRAGDIEATRRNWEEAWHWAPVAEDDVALVNVLLERLPKVREEGDYFRFLALAQRAVAVARRCFGTHHGITCTARFYFADALQLIGRPMDALREIDELLPIESEVKGELHHNTLATSQLRASVLHYLGRYDEALLAIDWLLPIETKVLGERHLEALRARSLRAYVLHDRGQCHLALAAIDDLLPIETEVLGERHRETLFTRGLRAALLHDLGHQDEALQVIEALMPILIEVGGEQHPQTLTTLRVRGSILREIGEVEAALSAHLAVHEGRVHALGYRHPHTLYAATDLGVSLAASGDAGGAEALLEATLAGQSEVLGVEHPDTRRTAEALAALRAQGAEVAAVTKQEEPAPAPPHS